LLDDNGALTEKDWIVNIQCYNDRLEHVHSKQFEGKGLKNTVLKLGNFDLNGEQTESSALFFVSEVKSGDALLFRTYYFFNFEVKKGSLFSLPQTSLESKHMDRKILIRNTGEHPAVGVNLKCQDFEDQFTASENYFWLNPNEEKIIEVNLDGEIEVDCWNRKIESFNAN
jgi:beta-mannosidase